MFGRKKRPKEPDPNGPADQHLPMLSLDQARALTDLAVAAFARRGVELTSAGDGSLVGSEGGRVGLYNVATIVAKLRWPAWQEAVERHVEIMTSATDSNADADPSQVYLQVHEANALPFQPDFDVATRFPGIIALPAVDHPTTVSEIAVAERLDGVAGCHSIEELRTLGLANLRSLPAPLHVAERTDADRADSLIHAFTSEDFFGAARVLVLDSLLSTSLSMERPRLGCIVAIPNRQMLVVHVIEGIGMIAAINVITDMAVGEHRNQPGPVSDRVFYVPPEGDAQSIVIRSDTELNFDATSPPFSEVFLRLGTPGD